MIDRVWVSDFTELPCRNGKAYAVAIMDLCSRRILGITVSHNMQTRTLIHTLNQACHVRRSRPTEPIVFHSINHLTPVQFEEELISQQRDQPTCL
ncbi:MAG: transposase family protein [Ignavibacteria bacterium]|nr:transposase family protein [Ignavibacteria bacterium]